MQAHLHASPKRLQGWIFFDLKSPQNEAYGIKPIGGFETLKGFILCLSVCVCVCVCVSA